MLRRRIWLKLLLVAAAAAVLAVSLAALWAVSRSRLIVRADTVQWHHLDYDAPGITTRGEVVPTEINGVARTPVWPDHDGLRNRFATRRSSVLRGIDPALPRGPADASLPVLRGGGRVEIIDRPRAENGYALTIEIEDHPNAANRYELEIRFRPAAAR